MAKPAIRFGELTDQQMNSGESYRVKLSYGTFSIARKVTQSGVYFYALKRVDGRLFKTYIGRVGSITRDAIHKATMALHHQYYPARAKDNRSRLQDLV